jgi:phage-related protein
VSKNRSRDRVGKTVVWVRKTDRVIFGFPINVRKTIGQALYEAELGGTHRLARPMKGNLRGVTEIRVDGNDGNTYRAMYIVTIGDHIYGLHAFLKKSHKDSATPQREIALIEQRLKEARAIDAEIRSFSQ